MLSSVKLYRLETPAALVDLDAVERNTSQMSQRIRRLGARLRPHVKTHKCVEAARLQVRGHFGGITVSTLAEARFFGEAGFRDITYAFPIPIARIEEAADLSRTVEVLNLLLDQEQTLRELEHCAAQKGIRFPVLLKVDSGYHRAGVNPARDESVALASKLAGSPHIDFRGILTHGGHSYHCRNPEEIRRVASEEREVMVGFAEKLRGANVPVAEVSIGSTPTMALTNCLDGVTEVRPGNYVFYDRFQAAIGSCAPDDMALSILVAVVGHYPEQNKLLINGGSLAFSMDPGPTHVDPDCGYGTFFSADGKNRLDDLRLVSISQEHGQVAGVRSLDFEAFPVGANLRVVPNHSCLASALYDRYYVTRGEEVVDDWKPTRGW
jgi:D-serine deaminase-like pyridoxal phosphate-dependent protein